jgi:hypothetical protein
MVASTQVSVRPRAGRWLYPLAASLTAVEVFAGFAPTYYLKLWFGTPSLSPLLHVHGLVMTVWFALFATQAWLVGSGRTAVHRRLGVFAAAWAALVVIVGTLTAITAARLGHSPGPPPLQFLVVPLGDMVLFTALAGTALWFRRRPEVHRRLMLLGGLCLLVAAFARLPWPREVAMPAAIAMMSALMLACVLVDTVRYRRLHPAFGWGVVLVLVSWPLRLQLADTALWQRFAQWLVG